jgi:hypothetical protein
LVNAADSLRRALATPPPLHARQWSSLRPGRRTGWCLPRQTWCHQRRIWWPGRFSEKRMTFLIRLLLVLMLRTKGNFVLDLPNHIVSFAHCNMTCTTWIFLIVVWCVPHVSLLVIVSLWIFVNLRQGYVAPEGYFLQWELRKISCWT